MITHVVSFRWKPETTAEQIKIQIGSAFPLPEELEMEVKGRDLVAGIPKTLRISSTEIRDALNEPVSIIIEAVKQALEQDSLISR